MTRDEIHARLVEWAAQQQAIAAVDAALTAQLGMSPESPLSDALSGTFQRYGDTLETLILGTAEAEWLQYFWLECRMGAHPLEVDDHGVVYRLDGLPVLADMLHAFRTAKAG